MVLNSRTPSDVGIVNSVRTLSKHLSTAFDMLRSRSLSTVHDNVPSPTLLEDLSTALNLLRFLTRSMVHDSGEPSRVFKQYFRENKEPS